MPGTNQPNVILFELVKITKSLSGGPTAVRTLAIHPFLTAPNASNVSSRARETVTQTDSGTLLQKAARALVPISYQGTFGVATRALGPFIGTGEQRERKFYAEVVVLGSCTSKPQVDAVLKGDISFGILGFEPPGAAPEFRFGLDERVASDLASFNPQTDALAVNLYDFFWRVFAQVSIQQFSRRFAYDNGGASGMTAYSLDVLEVGPLLATQGSAISGALQQVVAVYPQWRAVIDAVESFTVPALLDSIPGVANIVLALADEAVDAVVGQLQGIASLSGASGVPPTAALPNVSEGLGLIRGMQSDATAALDAVKAIVGLSPVKGAQGGEIDWTAEDTADTGLETHDATVSLEGLRDALAFPDVAGKFQGMGEDTWQAYIESAGNQQGPVIRDSRSYRVGSADTPRAISRAFGVSWADILDANKLTPDEALQPGRELLIPVIRARGPQGIDGLPILGSHLGVEALGRDMALETAPDADGDILTVTAGACLAQTMRVLYTEEAGNLNAGVESVPETMARAYIERRVRAVVTQDRRIASIQETDVQRTQAGFDVSITVRAITGETVTTG